MQRISCEVHPAGIATPARGLPPYGAMCNAKLHTNQPKTLPTTNRVFGTTLNIWLSARVPPSNCHTTDDSTIVNMSLSLICLNASSTPSGAHTTTRAHMQGLHVISSISVLMYLY
jgi:hypothetical protein